LETQILSLPNRRQNRQFSVPFRHGAPRKARLRLWKRRIAQRALQQVLPAQQSFGIRHLGNIGAGLRHSLPCTSTNQ
jgi:hypothetical protein